MLSVGAQIVDVYRAHANVTKSRARHHAVDMLALVGINDPERRFDAYPHELSGGMAQRAVIAMALVCEPKLLIADEPTSGVDVTIQAQILDDLARSARETGSAVLLVTQSLGILANYCDRALVMNGGLLIESASTQAFFRRPLHPSSRALLAGETGFRRSEALSGGGSGEGGNGCPISDWCPWADALRCVTELPQMIEVEADHDVRCHYATKLESDEGFTFHRHTAVDQTTAQ
jgi:ABC-type dipeptide/oligopeptide/nickel transport system ATPase component